MTKALVLDLLNFLMVSIVEFEAFGFGIGAILRQKRPFAFFNHAFHEKNLLLSTYEKKILALVLAILKWHSYMLGRKFMVFTDQSLKDFWDQKITMEAQQKWLYKLMGFDFIVVYKKGKENIVDDALS